MIPQNGAMQTSDRSGTFVFLPLEEATKPRTGECIVDCWWVHLPDQGLAFWKPAAWRAGLRPQCNTDQRIVDRILDGFDDGAEALFVPVVFTGPAPYGWD